jgi:hypothetical protein
VNQSTKVPAGRISEYQCISKEDETKAFSLTPEKLIRFPLMLWYPDMLFIFDRQASGRNFFEADLEAAKRDVVGRTDLRKPLKLFFRDIAYSKAESKGVNDGRVI